MDCEEVLGLMPAYVLEALEPGERRALESHLKHCRSCYRELEGYLKLTRQWLAETEPIPPPPHLKARLLAMVEAGEERKLRGLEKVLRLKALWPSAYHLSVGLNFTLTILLIASVIFLGIRIHRLESENEKMATTMETHSSLLYAFSSPDTIVVQLQGVKPYSQAQGFLYITPDYRRGVLLAFQLKPLPKDRVYQFWWRRGEERHNGGILQVDAQGNGWLTVEIPEAVTQYQGVGVTIEPRGGSTFPTGERVLYGRLTIDPHAPRGSYPFMRTRESGR